MPWKHASSTSRRMYSPVARGRASSRSATSSPRCGAGRACQGACCRGIQAWKSLHPRCFRCARCSGVSLMTSRGGCELSRAPIRGRADDGVGVIVALTFACAIDDPSRFKSSKAAGAGVFRHDANAISVRETDYSGRISKNGDGSVRAVLGESGHLILTTQRLHRAEELGDTHRQAGRDEESHGGVGPQTRRHHASGARRWHAVHNPAGRRAASRASTFVRIWAHPISSFFIALTARWCLRTSLA
jgi:hypothetical protein